MKATQYIAEQLVREFPFLQGFAPEDEEEMPYLMRLTPDESVVIARMSEETANRRLTDNYQSWDGTGWYEVGCAVLADDKIVPLTSGEKSETIGVQLSNLVEAGKPVEYVAIYGWERQYADREAECTLTIYKVRGKFDLSAWARRQRQRALVEFEAALAAANKD